MCRLICGDCMELLPEIRDGSVDMVLCDMPYGSTQNTWDQKLPLDKLWEQGLEYRILYVEADTPTIVRRYKSSRRPHPMQIQGVKRDIARIKTILKEKEISA